MRGLVYKRLTKKSTKKEIDVVCYHLETDLSFREAGTFNREPKDPQEQDFVFDNHEATIAERAIKKLRG